MDENHDKNRVILQKILDEQEYWLRLASLIHYFLEDLYNELLHKSSKLPSDPSELYKVLYKNHHRVESLLRRKKITQEQFSLIYPDNKKTEIWKFDISTFCFIVRYFTGIKPKGGWKLVNKLERGDKSKGAQLIELEHYITENIEGSEPIMKHRFDEDWSDAIYFLKGLKLNIKDTEELKNCSMKDGNIQEKYGQCVMKAQIQFLTDVHKKVKKEYDTLLEEDDSCENKDDITKRLEECQAIEIIIKELGEQNHGGTFKGTELYQKLYSVHHRLEAADTEMKFIKQMITFEKTASSNVILCQEQNGGEEEKEDEKNDEVDGKGDEENSDVPEIDLDPHDKTRYRDALRKLKSVYSNFLTRDDQDGDFDCCLQPYEKLELLIKTPIRKDSGSQDDTSCATYKENNIEQLNDLFMNTNHVLIRGVPGVGKTYLVREIISEWVHGHVFPDIKYLFVIDYKEVRDKLYESMEDLVAMLFPSVFEYVTWQEISSVPNQVLVIIDNWELFCEFGYVQPEETEFIRCISKGLGHTDGSLTTQKIAITTRPDSIDILVDNLEHVDFSIVDVLGFSDVTVSIYVSHFFNCNRKMLKIVKSKLQMNEHIRYLVYLPINLWSYCCIHQHNPNIGTITTTTELYFNKLVMLLQENINEPRRRNGSKTNLIENGVIASSMIEAAQCSYQSHTTTHSTSSPLKPIKDLLTSVYLYMLNVSPLDVLVDKKFKGCISYLSAMHGSYNSALASPTTLANSFIRTLDVEHNQDFVNQLFLSFIAPYRQTSEYYLDNEFVFFLQSYYEFQGYLVQNEEFKNKHIHISLHDMHLADVSCFIYFLNHEHYQLSIESIELHTHVPITESQMEQLAIHLLTIPKVSFDIKAFGHASEILHRVFENYQGTKEFEVKSKELTITQKFVYDIQYAVSFDWLVFLNHFNLIIRTNDVSYLIASLENVFPRGLSSGTDINLSHLKLTIQPETDALPATLLTLTKHFMYLKELQLELTHKKKMDDYAICNNNTIISTATTSTKLSSQSTNSSKSKYPGYNRREKVRMLEVPMIKYAIYRAVHLEERIMSNNIERLVVKDESCCYEFIMNGNDKRVALVVDRDDDPFVDVELITF